MDCQEARNRLSEFDAGDLSEDLAAEVRRHVEECRECAALLDAVRRVTDLAVALPDEEPRRTLSLRVLAEVDAMTGPDLADAPEIMTPEQLARFLRVPRAKIEDVMDTLPGFEIAGEVRFRKTRVLEWIEGREMTRGPGMRYGVLRAV